MDWLEFVKQVGDAPFKASMLIAISYGVRELSRMRKSMGQLNMSLAVIVERVSGHEKRITSLERKRK